MDGARDINWPVFGDQLFYQIFPTVSPPYSHIPKTPPLTRLT